MQPATLPFEVTAEELEALLESVRAGLGEAGYQKLKAAIRTMGYLTELLRERKITPEGLRELLLSGGLCNSIDTKFGQDFFTHPQVFLGKAARLIGTSFPWGTFRMSL
jgi:hypothetical protein